MFIYLDNPSPSSKFTVLTTKFPCSSPKNFRPYLLSITHHTADTYHHRNSQYGKHSVTGQIVVVAHLALKRLANITAPNVRDTRTGWPYFDIKLICQNALAIFL